MMSLKQTCPECGKHFSIEAHRKNGALITQWVYKTTKHGQSAYYCSWHCLQIAFKRAENAQRDKKIKQAYECAQTIRAKDVTPDTVKRIQDLIAQGMGDYKTANIIHCSAYIVGSIRSGDFFKCKKGRRVSDEKIKRIQRAIAQGHTNHMIMRMFDCALETVKKVRSGELVCANCE